MTTIDLTTPGIDAYAIAHRVGTACGIAIGRVPDIVAVSSPTGDHGASLVFDPDLSPEDQVTVDGIVEAQRAAVTLIPSEWSTIRPHLGTIRTIRQMTRNDFVNLSEADMRRAVYDHAVANAILWLAILRD